MRTIKDKIKLWQTECKNPVSQAKKGWTNNLQGVLFYARVVKSEHQLKWVGKGFHNIKYGMKWQLESNKDLRAKEYTKQMMTKHSTYLD